MTKLQAVEKQVMEYEVRFPIETIKAAWSQGKSMFILKRKYSVHKMSYGQFFLEPVGWTGGEMDGFADGTIWLTKHPENNQLFVFDTLVN